MRTLFEKIVNGHTLTEQEAYSLLSDICKGSVNETMIAAVMAFYCKKAVSMEELNGFRKALLDLCTPVNLSQQCIDVCGTGGDQKNTFNISTLSAFVIAASGIPVAKHGNYGSSSVSGSSDILKHFGYEFKSTAHDLQRELDKYNLCFIHAPLFHPALKAVAKQRKEFGLRTFFNLLGPLVNPSRPIYKYIGVYSVQVARLYKYILQSEEGKFVIANSLDGYDEVSLTSEFKLISRNTERTIEPLDLGFPSLSQKDIYGGTTIREAASIFLNVLNNSATEAQKKVVLVNSALALQCAREGNFTENYEICKENLESGKVYDLFKKIMSN